MKTITGVAACLLTWLGLTACTTIGTGRGELAGEPVLFNWTSTDGAMTGAMTATVAGQSWVGRFFQITQQSRVDAPMPLWHDGSDSGVVWPLVFREAQFVTHFSGKVIASMEAPSGQHMHCRFHLVVPMRGMAAGGEGQCQLDDGRQVRANFEPK